MKATIDTTVNGNAIKPAKLERVIVNATELEKTVPFPTEWCLLEIARSKVVKAAKAAGISLKQPITGEGKSLHRLAGSYASAKQFKRLRRTLKRQRTVLRIVARDMRRQMVNLYPQSAHVIRLNTGLERAVGLRTQHPKYKNRLYGMHALAVECIGKGKAKLPYEFGVKTSIAVTHRGGLVVGARRFPSSLDDGHFFSAQLEQTSILFEDTGKQPEQVFVDLGYRGVDADNLGVEILDRGKAKLLTQEQRRWLKRRQAIEPVTGHLKSVRRTSRYWLKRAVGDATDAVLSVAGYDMRWLLRAVAAGAIKELYFVRILLLLLSEIWSATSSADQKQWGSVQHGGRSLGHPIMFMRLEAAK